MVPGQIFLCFTLHNVLTCLCFVNRIRVPYPFQWGGPTFDAGESFAMMAASFAALIEVCFLQIFGLYFLNGFGNLKWLF